MNSRMSYYEKNKEKILKKLKEKYSSDEEFRDRVKKSNRQRYQKNPGYHEKNLNNAKARYHNDEDYREKTKRAALKRNQESKQLNKITNEHLKKFSNEYGTVVFVDGTYSLQAKHKNNGD